ncbi:hypothetical protein CHS0354_020102 [Potamilus streckersoni]|uniref:Ig-like domain-containing protein n=1 Tax=Potamilus streckersoni TaxID=2493646 RepID=A0AAE0VPP6_9BIVA|nr:hypothetical protein CHS0354_020102 [Potamilus streckersoni]
MGVGDDQAPRFTQKPSLKQEDNGKKLVFQCTLEASPQPEINWFRGTTPLTESDRVKMKVEPAGGNQYNVLMDINGVTQADAGSYKVVAKNKLGEVSASINLNFGETNPLTLHVTDDGILSFGKGASRYTIDSNHPGLNHLVYKCESRRPFGALKQDTT